MSTTYFTSTLPLIIGFSLIIVLNFTPALNPSHESGSEAYHIYYITPKLYTSIDFKDLELIPIQTSTLSVFPW